ncbi:MAG: ABC transporter ATP-binding protein [Eubacteriales bacterium]|nr:ABC transporter ATP-binding protein [Eubacteriales bacterium]
MQEKNSDLAVKRQIEILHEAERKNLAGSALSGRKGTWRDFFNLLFKTRIPWLYLLVTLGVGLIATKVGSLFPNYQTRYFAGELTRETIGVGIAILLGGLVLGIINNVFTGFTENTISKRLRNTLWERVISLPKVAFKKLSGREMISRITQDSDLLAATLVTVIITIISSTYGVYLYLRMIFEYHKTLAYVQFALVPVFLLLKFIAGRIQYNLSFRSRFRFASLTRYMASILVNIPLVKSYNREAYERVRGNMAIDEYNKVQFKLQAVGITFDLLDQAFQTLNDAICIIYGGYLVTQGELDIGTWIAFYTYSSGIYAMLTIVCNLWPMLKSAQGSVQRIADVLNIPAEKWQTEGEPAALGTELPELKLSDVTYGYNADDPVLKNINLNFPAGSTTYMVGPSGAGKTTLLLLLDRFYEPDSGQLSLNEHNAGEFGLYSWRKRFGYLQQEIVLFYGTMRENLTYGLKEAITDEAIEAVLAEVDMAKKVKEAGGLDAIVSEGGQSFSGGERQRLAIARLLLQNPQFVLLDEPLSNLDSRSEAQVRKALAKLSAGRTVVAVSHRLRKLNNAERILVLDKGEIVGLGKHDELLSNCPLYQELVDAELRIEKSGGQA